MSFLTGGKKETNTSSWLSPWAPAGDHLERMMEEMGPAYEAAQAAIDRGTPDDFVADLNQTQLDALRSMGGSNWTKRAEAQAQGIYTQGDQMARSGGDTMAGIASGQIKGGLDQDVFNDVYNEDLLRQQIDASGADIRRNLQEGELLNIDRQFAGMGGAGSSRAGVAEGVAIRGAQDRLGQTANTLRTNMYNQATNQAANFGQGNFNAIQNAGGTLLNTGAGMRESGMNSGATYGQNTVENAIRAGNTVQGQGQTEIQGVLDKNMLDSQLPFGAIDHVIGSTSGLAKDLGFNRTESEEEGGGGGLMGMVGSVVGGASSMAKK